MAPSDAAHLFYRLFGLVRRSSAGESTALMHRRGLTMAQVVTLHVLYRGDLSISALAERLGMSLPATSQLVDRLVDADLLGRAEDPADRRVRRLHLRPAGRQLLERLNELRLREIEEAFTALAPETRARLGAAVGAAVEELEATLASRPGRGASPRRS